jgi:hypothetical protein
MYRAVLAQQDADVADARAFGASMLPQSMRMHHHRRGGYAGAGHAASNIEKRSDRGARIIFGYDT